MTGKKKLPLFINGPGCGNKHKVSAEGILIEGPVIKMIRKIVEERHIDLVIAGNKKKDLVDELKIPLLAVPLDSNQKVPFYFITRTNKAIRR